MTTPGHRSVTVALITYNSARHLDAFFAALPAALEGVATHEVVVADNGSTDHTAAEVARLAPEARFLDLGGNKGYAAGVNAAATAGAGDAVLIVNPDVRLAPGSVARLLAALDRDGVGITVPRILDEHGNLDWTLRREPSVLRVWGEALLGGVRAGRVAALGELVVDRHRYDRPTTADWASGAVQAVSRRCLDTIGPWDESFFLYSEETEFGLRARAAGFATLLVPEAGAVHLRGESATAPTLRSIGAVNRFRLYERTHGRVRTAAFRAGLIVNEALRARRQPAHRAALRALVRGEAPT